MDTSNWMRSLPASLHTVPLSWLAIPGSHDSFSYSFTENSEIGPEDRRLQCIDDCLCFNGGMKRLVFKWSVTQTLTCTQQLAQGIRYFDFRLAAKFGTLTPFIIHGMFGANALDVLSEMYNFLARHPKEIVILDFQSFYDFTQEMHNHTIDSVKRIFGSLIYPFRATTPDLLTMWRLKRQVIIFYRDDYVEMLSPLVWPRMWIFNPWPQTCRASTMIRQLEENFRKGRESDYFYVSQGVLTPDFTFILTRFYSNLQRSLADKANRVLVDWLRGKSAGENGINIVIADFVEMKPYNFTRAVIKLNYVYAKRLVAKTKIPTNKRYTK